MSTVVFGPNPSNAVITGVINVGAGSSYDVGAALVAGSNTITVDTVASPSLYAALLNFPGLRVVGSSAGTPSVPDVLGPVVAHTGGNVGDFLAKTADGTYRPVTGVNGTGLAGATDGQLAAYSLALLGWTPVNPVGTSILAAAKNITGTPTSASAAAGVGTAVAIPGTAISVASSGGRQVRLEYGAIFQQTTAGDGIWLINVYETTSTPTSVAAIYSRLPNTNVTPMAYASGANIFDIGVVTTTRTFELRMQLWSPAASNPAGNVLNASNNPSFLRALAG